MRDLQALSQESYHFYKKAVEALLFVAGRPLKMRELSEILDGLSMDVLSQILKELQNEYAQRGIRIVQVAGGYRVESDPELAPYLKRLIQPKPLKWTKPLLETLAVIAYFQPITRAEISAKRGGVEVGPLLKTLLERKLIKVVGRKPIPGRPVLYGTTPFFLEYFGLNSLEDLPPLEELEKMLSGEEL